MDPAELTKDQRIILWVFGAIEQLKTWGLVDADFRTTTRGLGVWDQIDAETRPSDEDLCGVVQHVIGGSAEDQWGLVRLLVQFRDNRDAMAAAMEQNR